MKYYCTHFDINYISHALSLYESLIKHAGEFKIFMFCMDDEAYKNIGQRLLPNVTAISYNILEQAIPQLIIAKENRTRVEYFYTCSPAICHYVLKFYDEVDLITYLDSDLYFFSSPEPLFVELGHGSIGIIEHRFHWASRRNRIYGNFNVGWINFKRDHDGLTCLNDWMMNCIKWCFQRLEEGKYADQKYLDQWTSDYQNVRILNNKGANLAVWNIGNYKLKSLNDNILIDNEKLIFYHFASLKQISPNCFTSDLSRVFVSTTNLIRNRIYLPYITSLNKYKVNKIIPKKDTYQNKWVYHLKNITRNMRQLIYPDYIEIKN